MARVKPEWIVGWSGLVGATGSPGVDGSKGFTGLPGLPGDNGPRGFTDNTRLYNLLGLAGCLRIDNFGSTNAGLELTAASSGQQYVTAYDRTISIYSPLQIGGSTVTTTVNGTAVLAVTSTAATFSVPIIINQGLASNVILDTNLAGCLRLRNSAYTAGVELATNGAATYFRAYDRTASAYKSMIIDNADTDLQIAASSVLHLTSAAATFNIPVLMNYSLTTASGTLTSGAMTINVPTVLNGTFTTNSNATMAVVTTASLTTQEILYNIQSTSDSPLNVTGYSVIQWTGTEPSFPIIGGLQGQIVYIYIYTPLVKAPCEVLYLDYDGNLQSYTTGNTCGGGVTFMCVLNGRFVVV